MKHHHRSLSDIVMQVAKNNGAETLSDRLWEHYTEDSAYHVPVESVKDEIRAVSAEATELHPHTQKGNS